MPWGTGSNRLFSKIVTNSKKAKHSFVDACFTHCPKPGRLNNSQQKVLPFLFKDFLLVSGRVQSRDKIYIIEKHLTDENYPCMYLGKSHFSNT